MRAGRLTELVTIQAMSVGKDKSGGVLAVWTDFAKDLPASRFDFSGNEKPSTTVGGGEVAVSRVEFTVRWLPGVNATMRVVHDGEFFNIRHPKPIAGRRRSLVLTCDTGANDG